MQDAYEMAVEALGLCLTERKKDGDVIPDPTEINKIDTEDGVLVIVEFDMLEYQRSTIRVRLKRHLVFRNG